MAIAYDNETTQDSSGYVNSLTFAHSVAGSDRGLAVGVACRTGVADVSGITYNSTSLASETNSENTNVCGVTTWSLIAPSTGSNNVVVSLANFRLLTATAISFTGVDQTDMVEAGVAANNYGVQAEDLITTTTDDAWLVDFLNLQGARTVTSGDYDDGELGDQGNNSSSSADAKIATPITAVGSGTLRELHARLYVGGSGSTVAKPVIYSDNSGSPDALLAEGDELSITNNTEQELTFTFTGAAQIDITAGTDYWIGVHYQDPGTESLFWSRGTTSSVANKENETYSDGASDPWGTGSALTGPLDIFVMYDTGQTQRNSSDHSDSNLGQAVCSTLPVGTAGQYLMSHQWSSDDNWAIAVLAIKPAAGVTTTSITKSLSYEVVSNTAITKSLSYEVVSTPSAITKSLTYEVVSTPSAITKSLAYEVQSQVAITKSLTYEVTAVVAITKSLSYEVTSNSSITKSLQYTVIATPSAITKSLEYVVINQAAITKSLEYQVVAPVAITKTLSYEVQSIVAITKSLAYEVQSIVSITKTLTYEVTAQQAITKSLEYQVQSNVAITKSLTYAIAGGTTEVAITKTLAYYVTSNTTITKSLQYYVINSPYSKTSGVYSKDPVFTKTADTYRRY